MLKNKFFILLVLLYSLNINVGWSCGPHYAEHDDYYFSPFNDFLYQKVPLRPFILTGKHLFPTEIKEEDENLKAWLKELKIENKHCDELEKFIYSSSIEEIKEFKEKKNNYFGTLYKSCPNIVKAVAKNKAFLKYMLMAKKAEKHSVPAAYWEAVDPNDPKEITFEASSQNILNAFYKEKNLELKARYAFQYCKILNYAGEHQTAITFYKKVRSQLNSASVIQYWLDWQFVKATWRMYEYDMPIDIKVKYSLALAQVFYHSDKYKSYAFGSFYIKDEQEWQKCLEAAKTNEDKAALWLLTAIDPHQIGIEALQKIIDLKASSKYIQLLISRELNKMERQLLKADNWKHQETRNTLLSKESKRYQKLLQLIDNYRKATQVKLTDKDRQFLNFSLAYLNYLTGDFSKSKKLLAENPAFQNNSSYQALGLLLKIEQQEINKAIELAAFKLINHKSTEKQLKGLLYARLGQKYFIEKKFAQHEMCLANFYNMFVDTHYNIRMHPGKKHIPELLAYRNANELSEWDKHLLKTCPSEDELVEILGTIALSKFEFDQALTQFEQLPDDYHLTHPKYNMKAMLVNDINIEPEYQDIEWAADWRMQYEEKFKYEAKDFEHNKLTFTRAVLEKQAAAKNATNEEQRAVLYMDLAKIYYHMQDYGKHWNAVCYYTRHGNCSYGWGNGCDDYYAFNKIEHAIEALTEVTKLSKNKKLLAEAYIKIGICQTRLDPKSDYQLHTPLTAKNAHGYSIAHEHFNDSFYYQYISSCSYFEGYIKEHYGNN